jgi:hypothetical protein
MDAQKAEDVFVKAMEEVKNQTSKPRKSWHSKGMGITHQWFPKGILEII